MKCEKRKYDKKSTQASEDSEFISDGFGNVWSAYCPICGEKAMEVVRPGKVQCSACKADHANWL